MTEKKRILQPVNLIVFLIFALAAEVVACLPLFKGANMFLQIGWTCYLLVGMVFLFFVGEKVARVKVVEKYLLDPKVGRFFTGCLLFFVCIGAGVAFRIWETVEGSGFISKNFSFNLAYYLIIGVIVYFTAKLISGFKGTTAAVILMALCPFLDFSAKLPVRECIYTLLVLAAIYFISLANYFVEKKSVSLQDTLLTILGAVSLAGATFLHISAVVLIFPCIFLLIRKSGVAMRGKREQRGLRSLLFEVFYICSLVVIFLIYSVEQQAQIVDIPIDYDLFHVISKEPMHVLEIFIDKVSKLFAVNNPGEYYNGLLMGMLLLGMIGAILLFKKKTERKFFPVYLFNWYFFFGILLKESAYSGLVLYALLAYMTAGTMEDLSELVFAGKRKGQDELAEEEKKEIQEDFVAEEQVEEQIEEQASEKKLEMDAALKEAEKKLPKPEVPVLEEAEAKKPEEKEAAPEPEEGPETVQEASEIETEMLSESEALPEPEIVSEPEPEALPEPEIVSEPEPETLPEPETVTEVKEPEEAEVEEPEEKVIVPEPEEEPEIVQEASEIETEMLSESEALPEPEIVLEPEPETLPEPETVTEVKEPEPEKVPVSLAKPEAKKVPVSLALENPLEKQMDEMIKREGRIMEIVEKQNTRIAKLEEELREQRIRTKNMERHYRKELAISRNKKR